MGDFLVQAPPMDSVGPLSRKLFAAAKEHIPGGVNSPVRAFRNVGGEPFFVHKAAGSRIEDVDGKTYIDYIGSWGPNILGHAPVVITNTIHEVAKNGVSFGIPNPFEVEMARTICDWVPSVQKVRMCSSGTEATMSAIRLARGFTKRDFIIKFDGCYHGHSDSLLVAAGSGALTHGEPDSAGVPGSFAEKTIVLPYNHPEALEKVFAEQGEQIAAIIVESYPANAGFVMPKPGYLELLSSITAKHGALLIFDEVMTGFRLGKAGVQGLENITPDLSCFGKVIGGGLPVGAFGGRADIMDQLAPDGPVYQAGTLSGNPIAAVAGLKTMEILRRPGQYEQLIANGQTIMAALNEHLTAAGVPHQVVGDPVLFDVVFSPKEVVDYRGVLAGDLETAKRFNALLREQGIFKSGSKWYPSLALGEEDLSKTVSAIERAANLL